MLYTSFDLSCLMTPSKSTIVFIGAVLVRAYPFLTTSTRASMNHISTIPNLLHISFNISMLLIYVIPSFELFTSEYFISYNTYDISINQSIDQMA